MKMRCIWYSPTFADAGILLRMHTRPRYKGNLARTIPRDEAEAKGPTVFVERLVELAEHYGIDHQNQPLNEWLAALASALAAAHVPGFQIETTPRKPGGRPAVRKPWEDAAVLYAVERYQDEHMRGQKRKNYKQACKLVAKRSREDRLTPELEIIPATYLANDTKGSVEGKLRAACDRAGKRRKRAEEIPDASPIGKLLYAMLTKL